MLFYFYQDPYQGNGATAALGSILALVVLQNTFLVNEILPLDYLTFEDKFMTVSYLIILYPVIGSLLQRKFNIQEDLAEKIKLNQKMFKILPAVIIAMFLFLELLDVYL